MAAVTDAGREADRLPDLAPTITSITSAACRSSRSGSRSAPSSITGRRSRSASRCRASRRPTPSCTARRSIIVVKPGDRVPITGLDWRIVTSAGQVLKTPLPGGGKPNPACASFTPKEITERSRERPVGGERRHARAVPADRSRRPAVEQGARADVPEQPDRDGRSVPGDAPRTGLSPDPPALVHGLQPRVAVMQNGTRKGAGAQVMPTMRTSPGLEDIWQLHWSLRGRHRAEQRRRVRRQRRRQRHDCRRPDRAAAQGGPGRGAGPVPGLRPPAAGAPGTGRWPAAAAGAPVRRRRLPGCHRRSARRDRTASGCAAGPPPAGGPPQGSLARQAADAAMLPPRTRRPTDQDFGAAGRVVHRHQHSQRVHERPTRRVRAPSSGGYVRSEESR